MAGRRSTSEGDGGNRNDKRMRQPQVVRNVALAHALFQRTPDIMDTRCQPLPAGRGLDGGERGGKERGASITLPLSASEYSLVVSARKTGEGEVGCASGRGREPR